MKGTWAIVLALITSGLEAGVYRWVDEQGEVHYSDRVPPNQASLGSAALNKHGQIISEVAPAKTEAAILSEQRAAEQAAIQRALEEAQAQQDRALLETFDSVKDLELARDDRIALITSAITLAEQKLLRLKTEQTDLEQRASRLKAQNTPTPGDLAQHLATVTENISKAGQLIEQKARERQAIEDTFARDIARFTALTANRQATR